MAIGLEPMRTIADGAPGAGGHREHHIRVFTRDGAAVLTRYPHGPAFNEVG